MTKIEFLSASLPYGLNVICKYDDEDIVENLTGVTCYGEQIHCDDYEGEIKNVIPIIRHIDTLTQECVQADYNDGRPFIPIVELAKLQWPTFTWHLKNNRAESTEKAMFTLEDGVFYIHTVFGIEVKDQLPLIQQLLKFHFWPNKPEGEEVVYVSEEFNPYC